MSANNPEWVGPKYVAEKVTASFDFTALLPSGVTISSPALSVSVHEGTDASPSAMLSGAAQVSGASVLQLLIGGVANVTYLIVCQVDCSDSQRRILRMFLPVRAP